MSTASDTVKTQLLSNIRAERARFETKAAAFYDESQRDSETYLALANDLLATLDGVLSEPGTEDSLFLRNLLKPFKAMRDEIITVKQQLISKQQHGADKSLEPVSADSIKLYLSLYQSNGNDMKLWAAQVGSVDSYMMGRPAYREESEVQALIRTKVGRTSEAYVVVKVSKNDIYDDDLGRSRKDRLGHSILNLKAKAITPDNVLEFVHMNKRYFYSNAQLVEQRG